MVPNNSIKPTWLRHAAYFRRQVYMPFTRRVMIAFMVLTTLGLLLGTIEILGGPALIDTYFSPWFAAPALVILFLVAPYIDRYIPYKRGGN